MKTLLLSLILVGNLQSQTNILLQKENRHCNNYLNLDEYIFIYSSILNKLEARSSTIQVHDAIIAFSIHASFSQFEDCYYDGYNAIRIFNGIEFNRYKNVIKSLFSDNVSTTRGYGIYYENYNFKRGGIRDPCCCFDVYDINRINIDSIGSAIPISNFYFDYLCSEMLRSISNEYFDYKRAIITCRILNTINALKLANPVHERFKKIMSNPEIQAELNDVLKMKSPDYVVHMNGIGELDKKASRYEISDINNPIIKYNFE